MIMMHRVVTFNLEETLSPPLFDELSGQVGESHVIRNCVAGL